MKKLLLLSALLISSITIAQDKIISLDNGKKIILYSDKTWDYYSGISYDYDFSTLESNEIPSFLRQGISVDKATLKTAIEMYLQGWRYTMPIPKSPQASWGNSDGRTTWWNGYWFNNKTYKYSRTVPKKQTNGYYYGDAQDDKGSWRNGGSPRTPTKIDWLLSMSGGRKPN